MEKTFGEFLAERRKGVGLTQKELAGMVFVSESAVSKWEKDRAYPEITLLPKLAEILKVSEHELITSSVDKKQRQNAIGAKKWKVFSSAWELFFAISYAIAILTCFIVNLCVSKNLTWFWIVLTAILLGASFTSTPKYIRKYRLLFVPLSELGALLLLLAVCCLVTNGTWFWVATFPIVMAFVAIFLPFWIKMYKFPSIFKQNNALFCVIVDYILIFCLLLVVNDYTGGTWVFDFALPIETFCLILPLSFVLIDKLKIGAWIKAGINLLVSCVFAGTAKLVVDSLIELEFGLYTKSTTPNFADWNGDIIADNVIMIIAIILLCLAISFLLVGFLKRRRQIKNHKH